MAHGRRARRKQREVGAPGPLQFQLIVLEAVAYLVVTDSRRAGRRLSYILDLSELRRAERLVRGRRRGVVPVTVDDHGDLPGAEVTNTSSMFSSSALAAAECAAAQSCHSAHAALMRGEHPASSTVRATSRISSARRRPCSKARDSMQREL